MLCGMPESCMNSHIRQATQAHSYGEPAKPTQKYSITPHWDRERLKGGKSGSHNSHKSCCPLSLHIFIPPGQCCFLLCSYLQKEKGQLLNNNPESSIDSLLLARYMYNFLFPFHIEVRYFWSK